MNVDDMRTYAMNTEVINRIIHVGAEIACIQETHDAVNTTSNMEG